MAFRRPVAYKQLGQWFEEGSYKPMLGVWQQSNLSKKRPFGELLCIQQREVTVLEWRQAYTKGKSNEDPKDLR